MRLLIVSLVVCVLALCAGAAETRAADEFWPIYPPYPYRAGHYPKADWYYDMPPYVAMKPSFYRKRYFMMARGSCVADRAPIDGRLFAIPCAAAAAVALSGRGFFRRWRSECRDDAFAARGVLFENLIAESASTDPSHMTMFTSLPAAVHGVTSGMKPLAVPAITLAEALRGHGYRTAAFTEDGPLAHDRGFARGFGNLTRLLFADLMKRFANFGFINRSAHPLSPKTRRTYHTHRTNRTYRKMYLAIVCSCMFDVPS